MKNAENKEEKALNDEDLIQGLKHFDPDIIHRFFYRELYSLITHLQFRLFNAKVEYDEIVSELYLYLSANGWNKLDSFKAINGCRLRTWMTPVSWRYLVKHYDSLVVKDFSELNEGCDSDDLLEKKIEILMDLKHTLKMMTNQRYVEAIELLIVEGFPVAEVAEKWNTSVDNVYNIKHRAIKRFLELYED